MRLAAVQMEPRFGDVAANLRKARELITSVKADLFVLPELFNTGYLFRDRQETASFAEPFPEGETPGFILDLSAQTGAVIVGGFAERSRDGRIFNSAVMADQGRLLGCYRKIHLFDREKQWFDPADRPARVLESSAGRLGPMICFDWIFPETARALALSGAQILVHAANLVMPYCQDAMITRCLENGVFAVTANRIGTDQRQSGSITFTGRSQITGRRGERLAQASLDREEVIIAEIHPALADDKMVNRANHLLRDRRPAFYGHL
ncbi:MAG: acyltransferase [Candidatus Eisenbacteria sp.]|nr:acyltransferase [Candidatus Eisenbacteria bacterium]